MATTQTIDATIFASSHPDIANTYKCFRSFNFFCNVIGRYFSFCFHFRIG